MRASSSSRKRPAVTISPRRQEQSPPCNWRTGPMHLTPQAAGFQTQTDSSGRTTGHRPSFSNEEASERSFSASDRASTRHSSAPSPIPSNKAGYPLWKSERARMGPSFLVRIRRFRRARSVSATRYPHGGGAPASFRREGSPPPSKGVGPGAAAGAASGRAFGAAPGRSSRQGRHGQQAQPCFSSESWLAE